MPAGVGERSLLERHLQLLKDAGADEVVLALGFLHEQVEAHLESLSAYWRPQVVPNPGFELGSVLTLHTPADAMTCGGDVLVMDADFPPDVERAAREILPQL